MTESQKSFPIAVAQINSTVGDYEANYHKIISFITAAEKNNFVLTVFPECALCGYPVWDLANKLDFVKAGIKYLKKITHWTRNKKGAAIVGFIDREKKKEGTKFYNAAAWIESGKIRAVYHKRLLPTNDVFLEKIFFEKGNKPCVVSFRGKKIGISICEDLWSKNYSEKPIKDLKKKGVDIVINISASPFYHGVFKKRLNLVSSHARKYKLPIVYVNQVGGQDDLIFDGRSFAVNSNGKVHFIAPAFSENDVSFLEAENPRSYSFRKSDSIENVYAALVTGVRDYFKKNGFERALIGLSGGIDSALVAAIATDALGKDSVKGVTMPGPFSSKGSWRDAETLAKNLEIEFEVRPIKKMYKNFLKSKSGLSPTLAMENLQARLRGLQLMYLSNDEGRLVLTTGNKSELAMGYCTLYGDMAGGLAVIGDVYKTDVYELARFRNSVSKVIPDETLTKPPSAELRPNQRDQDTLPPYEILDAVLRLYIEENKSAAAIAKKIKGKMSLKLINETIKKVDGNEYKRRQTPPILRVTEKAWFGRRMPITNRYR